MMKTDDKKDRKRRIQWWNILLVAMAIVFLVACIYKPEQEPKSSIIETELEGVNAIWFSPDEKAFIEPMKKLAQYTPVEIPEEVLYIINNLHLTDTRGESGGYTTNARITNSILFMKPDKTYIQADFIDPNIRFYDSRGTFISEFEMDKKVVKIFRERLRKMEGLLADSK